MLKSGEGKDGKIVGQYGLGHRNEQGDISACSVL